MKEFWSELWNSKTFFARVVRGLLLGGAAYAAAKGQSEVAGVIGTMAGLVSSNTTPSQ